MRKGFLLFSLVISSSNAFGRSNLFTKSQADARAVQNEDRKEDKGVKRENENPKKQSLPLESGNLPLQYRSRHAVSGFDSNPVITPTAKRFVQNGKFKIAEVIQAEIKESLFAFAESKSPIRAVVTRGDLKGTIFLGEASLEKNSKRILISFKKLREPEKETSWNLQASALDSKGILGIQGKLESGHTTYFAAELLSAGAAGYADASIQRERTVLGNQVETPTTDTLAKKAMVSALSKSSERFGEQLKGAPEFSYLEGPFNIQILITEQPRLEE